MGAERRAECASLLGVAVSDGSLTSVPHAFMNIRWEQVTGAVLPSLR